MDIALFWLTPLLRKGLKSSLDATDLPPIAPANSSAAAAASLQRLSSVFHQVSYPAFYSALFEALFRAHWREWLAGAVCDTLSNGFALAVPILISKIVDSLGTNEAKPLVVAMFVCVLGRLVFRQIAAQLHRDVQYRVKAALSGAIFEKAFRLSTASSKEFNDGRILLMINVDVPAIMRIILNIHKSVMIPFQIIGMLVLLYSLIGISIIPAIATVILGLGFQSLLLHYSTPSQRNLLTKSDRRISLIKETFQAIKIIKLRGAEGHFLSIIEAARSTQLVSLVLYNAFIGSVFAILSVIPTLIPMSSFIFYAVHNSSFSANLIFPALAYFQMLFQPLNDFPQVLMGLIACKISWKRVTEFLAAEENESVSSNKLHPTQAVAAPDDKNAISFHASFEWTVREPAFEAADMGSLPNKTISGLFDWKLDVKKGSLVAIVGSVGSGKSSFFSACTGQMTKTDGNVRVNGSVAICLQQPWLYSDSVKDNIVFGHDFDVARFENAVEMCALSSDICDFQNGIDTLIGEKGISLSGGQKARVALARAVYDDPDIFLLDDPLAALDAHVGKHIFEKCIKGLKERKKTVLLSTHQLHVLPHVDYVVVVDEGGIVEQGIFADLAVRERGVLAELVKNMKLGSPENESNNVKDDDGKTFEIQKEPKNDGLAVAEEDRERGAVKLSNLWQYYQFGGGWPFVILLLVLLTLLAGTMFFSQYALVWWTSDTLGWTSAQYLNLYTYVSMGQILVFVLFSSLLNYIGYMAAKNFHHQAMSSLCRAPMSFFDNQPIGRIIYRLSNDVQEIDMNLWWIFLNVYYLGAGALCSLIIMVVLSPYMLILIAGIAVLNLQTVRLYRSNFRELKRISVTQASPVSGFISETLSGLSTIRTFRGASDRAIARQRILLDASLVAAYVQDSLSIWVNLRIGLFTAMTVFGVGLLGVFLQNGGGSGGNKEALMGAALASSWQISVTITQLVFMSGMLDLGMVSIERLTHYATKLPCEKEAHCECDPKDGEEWPQRGEIEFENVVLKYESRDAPVINDLSLKIAAGEKVGVCGRTGSGKSSLLGCLFRIVELSGGRICIDGQDIGLMGLSTLRSRLQIIPQEPVMFSGTIRSNLDYYNEFQDADIWEALHLVGLAECLEKLESEVENNGENFSVGQRQLMCLARAILHKPKILVLDEASSAVDTQSDLLIQKVIKSQFSESTVISIAHRLNTIMDADRVMVLDAGRVVELGSPSNLLQIEGGVFRRLVHEELKEGYHKSH
ncbi:Canalicular multispecific organic anion transporter 2 [Chytriomyces hyalinus]|nr:Canalicular multispecific organic anion transporter 2 [Chytriomyces hyalinus]